MGIIKRIIGETLEWIAMHPAIFINSICGIGMNFAFGFKMAIGIMCAITFHMVLNRI